MPRKGEYLFKRKGSQNWWARFRYTGELAKSLGTRMREHSLGTPDRREAELKVLPLIQQHKRLLLIHTAGGLHNILEERFAHDPLPPGEHVLPSGDRVLSTGDKLIYLDKLSPHYLREIPIGRFGVCASKPKRRSGWPSARHILRSRQPATAIERSSTTGSKWD